MLRPRGPALVFGLLLAAIAFPLAFAVPANAGWKMNRASAIARIVWHHPCVDRMRIIWVQPTTSLANDAHATTYDCTVRLSAALPLDWDQFCMLVLHEAGHLANYRDPSNAGDTLHSRAAGSIMHSPINAGEPRCRDRGRPFLKTHEHALTVPLARRGGS